jgi:hypothetical protein
MVFLYGMQVLHLKFVVSVGIEGFFDSSLFDVFADLIKSQVVWSLDMKRLIGTFFPNGIPTYLTIGDLKSF